MSMKRHNPAGWQQQEAIWHILLEHIRPFKVWDLDECGCRAVWNSGLRLDRYYLRRMSACRGRLGEPLCTSYWRRIDLNAERFTKLSGSMLPRAHQLVCQEAFERGSVLLPSPHISHHLKDGVSYMRFIFDGKIGGVVIAFLPLDIKSLQTRSPVVPYALMSQAIQPTLPADNERDLCGNGFPASQAKTFMPGQHKRQIGTSELI